MSNPTRSYLAVYTAVVVLLLTLPGCALVYYSGMPFVYDTTRVPSERSFLDIAYTPGGNDEPKHRLNFYVPDSGTDWPILVFVHGGGWSSGDKDFTFGGKDIYSNIGRFYASRGIATAVINYRLIPGVHWETQVNDVARSVVWLHQNAESYGADPANIFLSGHSAGAHLVARVALDQSVMWRVGGPENAIAGVVAVSGAGYDMADEETNRNGIMTGYLNKRFPLVDKSDTWPVDASVLQHIDSTDPPFLIMYGGSELKALKRQSHLLKEKLDDAAVENTMIEIPGRKHARMILLLSRENETASTAVTEFVKRHVTDVSNVSTNK